ncbi:hypothetical protein [Brevibacillus reuszeri]|uniref:hypothetical protein n=1 Tax=Brevibacillus reuszeri TaxID=54915 RepID=UPI000CCC01FE|nr:hypothetical protein [Brevibacillus reuszeri]
MGTKTRVALNVTKFSKVEIQNKLLQLWCIGVIALCIVAGIWLKSYVHVITSILTISFVIPTSVCISIIVDRKYQNTRLKWALIALPFLVLMTIGGALLLIPVEPYTVSYPKRIIPINSEIIKMKFTKDSHFYQVSVGSQVVTNKLQELYVEYLGAGKMDRRYLSLQCMDSQNQSLEISTYEASIKPIISALTYLNQRPSFTEKIRINVNRNTGALQNGDIVMSINDKQITTSQELQQLLVTPDTILSFLIDREGKELIIQFRADEFSDYANQVQLHLSSTIDLSSELPIQTYISKEMLGDSNGLPKTLEIIHQMSSDLIKGRKIIATGSVQTDGTIHAVGGIEYKLITLSESTFDFCFIPEANRNEVERAIGSGLIPRLTGELVYVKTVSDVISILKDS